jgi:hypothetical protein
MTSINPLSLAAPRPPPSFLCCWQATTVAPVPASVDADLLDSSCGWIFPHVDMLHGICFWCFPVFGASTSACLPAAVWWLFRRPAVVEHTESFLSPTSVFAVDFVVVVSCFLGGCSSDLAPFWHVARLLSNALIDTRPRLVGVVCDAPGF